MVVGASVLVDFEVIRRLSNALRSWATSSVQDGCTKAAAFTRCPRRMQRNPASVKENRLSSRALSGADYRLAIERDGRYTRPARGTASRPLTGYSGS